MRNQEHIVLKKSRVILILTGICLIGALLLSGCGPKSIAKNGDTVQVNYTLTLADGTVYDTSVGKQPLELIIGKGNYIPDFEKAIVGMKVGESKTITILAADAYGAPSDSLIFTVDRSQLAAGLSPKVGDRLQSTDSSGQTTVFTVKAVSDNTVTLDANSPLAGQDLTFKIELLKIS